MVFSVCFGLICFSFELVDGEGLKMQWFYMVDTSWSDWVSNMGE